MLIGAEGRKAQRYTRDLRAEVEKRMREKGITLQEALEEIQAEGKFSAENADRDRCLAALQRDKTSSKGWGRDCLARRVAEKQQELEMRDCTLSGVDAFKQATEFVLKQNRHLLADYRRDVEAI
jgi:hypothetical protein